MFRPMRRAKQQLSQEECIQLLKEEPRGVLSLLGDDDYPYGLPMDHFYCEEDGKLYFHCAKTGHKLDAIAKHDKASFCVYDQGYRKEGDWALTIRSVILFGRMSIVEDQEKAVAMIRRLAHKYTSDSEMIEEVIRTSTANVVCLCLTPEQITGKLVHEA